MDIYEFWKQEEKHELSLKKKGLTQLRKARRRLERYMTERGGHEKEIEGLLHLKSVMAMSRLDRS